MEAKEKKEFIEKVIEDVFLSAELSREKIKESEIQDGYPNYFKSSKYGLDEEDGVYAKEFKNLLNKRKFLAKYEGNELKWKPDENGKLLPPKMLAFYSSSRIGLFYFLKKEQNENIEFEPEKTEKVNHIGGRYPPHYDFYWEEKHEGKKIFHYVECKTTEVCESHSFELRASYKKALNDFLKDFLKTELKSIEIKEKYDPVSVGGYELEDNQYLIQYVERENQKTHKNTVEKFIILSKKLTGIDLQCMKTKYPVDFKQMICHLLGICSAISRANVEGTTYYLDYYFFTPSGCGNEHPLKEKIKNEFEAFTNSKFFGCLQNYAITKGCTLELSMPQFPIIKDEYKDLVLEKIKGEIVKSE